MIPVLDLTLRDDPVWQKRLIVEAEVHVLARLYAMVSDAEAKTVPRVRMVRTRPEKPIRCGATLLSLQCVLRDGHAGLHRFRPWSGV